MPARSSPASLVAVVLTLIVAVSAEARGPVFAMALAIAAWLIVLTVERILWNTAARATALLVAASVIGLSGVVALTHVHSTTAHVAGWSAIGVSATCLLLSHRTWAAPRKN
jgi:hypothetical protein